MWGKHYNGVQLCLSSQPCTQWLRKSLKIGQLRVFTPWTSANGKTRDFFFFFFLRVSGWPAVFFSCIWLMGGTQGILEGSEFFTSPSVAPLSCTSLEGWWQLLTGANLQVASLSAICCWVSQLFYPYCNQFPGLNSFCLKYLNGFLFPDLILSDTHSKFI